MRGVRHNVIEIKDSENSEIEKILVFLRPGKHDIDIEKADSGAREILKRVKIKKFKYNLSKSLPKLLLAAAVLAVIAAVGIILI